MLRPDQLKFFADFIYQELGIVYSETNYFQLQNRILEISNLLNLGGDQAVWEKAKKEISGILKQVLLDTATNNETSFFRDPKLFLAIEKGLIPEWIKRKEKVRIWSAASSFGQEPYTVAMLLEEARVTSPTLDYEIIATDVSDTALKRAKAGIYTQLEIQRGLSAQRLIKHFEKASEDHWKVKPNLQSKVSFFHQNLLDPFQLKGKFDLILCRNVLIYQEVENKKKILKRMNELLNHNGYLALGSGETLIGLSEDYKLQMVEGAIIYQVKPKGSQPLNLSEIKKAA